MARNWTPEARARQAALIHAWAPWTRSTGATTPEGKAKSAQNRQLSLERARAEIEQAQRELADAKVELQRLTGGHGDDLDMESMKQLLHKLLRNP